MHLKQLLTLWVMFFFACLAKAQPGLIISEILANPSGTDSPFEFVELLATTSIDFSVTPYTVIANNNGTANANGWVAGGSLSYAFEINSGSVSKGDVVYVGGSSISVSGAKLRLINTGTTGGDGGIGNANSSGVFGNGGSNADGIGIFNLPISSITSSSVPVDALFYGTATGSAVVSGGTAGYELPANDLYNGGKFQATSFVAPDPGSAVYLVGTGTYNVSSHDFTTARTFSLVSSFTDNMSSITLIGGEDAEINISPTSLSFYALENDWSVIKSYRLTGNALTEDVTVETSTPFAISLDSLGTYNDQLSVSAEEVMIGVKIFVRYHPVNTGPHSSTVDHTSQTVTQSLNLSGTTLSLTEIYNIQGSGFSSPIASATVVTKGIVTADFQEANELKGFFIQDETGDNDIMTSDGIFVYDNLSMIEVTVGDEVEVTGVVNEYYGRTQLESIIDIRILSTGHTINPVSLTLPVNAWKENREHCEGMLVKLDEPLYVTENYDLGRYGEVSLAKDSFIVNPTNYIDLNDDPATGTSYSGTSNLSSILVQMTIDSSRVIVLDDYSDVENPALVPFIDASNHSLRIGSSFTFAKAILDYAYGAYRLEPIEYTVAGDARPEVPSFPSATLIAVSQNVLNYFNGDGQGGGFPTARGASNSNELARQSEKIFAALYQMNPDVAGLMEMENDGDGDFSAIHTFTEGLNLYIQNKTGISNMYSFVPDPDFIGSDAIKCAMIYKSSVLERKDQVYTSMDVVFSRPPIAQAFHVTGSDHDFLFVVNHFKSKGCTDATGNDIDQLDGQGCYNEKRRNQAGVLVNFIEQTMNAQSVDKFLSVGDYNAYEQEDPIDLLRTSGYTNLINHSYSFVFNGMAGSLDHGFVNDEMLTHISGASKWHINAVEPRLLDYNTEYNPAYVYTNDAFRCSDHDPLMVAMNFESVVTSVWEDEKQAYITVFPNPVQDQLCISNTMAGESMIIYDLLGNIMWYGVTSDHKTVIDTKKWVAGMYVISYAQQHIQVVKR